MAKDDIHVIVYRILAYMYPCMKKGVDPRESDISAEARGINEENRRSIVRELQENGCIRGAYNKVASEIRLEPAW